ncbi:MAG: FKBP-type peptidyl-prolyl cis-trans isomerase, partial [Myxococcota bacterium]|nr:FKBP-type peptidyl-prolyl cis-trans isomerase [Myxococcota bacterium]
VHELPADAVDGEINRLQAAQAERVPVEERAAEEGDILVLSTHGTLDGEKDERLHTHDMEIKLGSGQLIPGFEEQMIGASNGDNRTVEVSFPDDYNSEDLRGKPAVFEVSVDGHFIEELPELNDDFAQDIGHDSMEALRENVTQQFQDNMDEERNRVIDENLVTVLLERQPVTAPPTMVQGQLEHQARRLTQMLLMQGVPYEQAIGMAQNNQEAIIRESMPAVQRYHILEAVAK